MRPAIWTILTALTVTICTGPSAAQNPFKAAEADFDGSGIVDFADFLLLINEFGGSNTAFDLDGKGGVDLADFIQFVSAFNRPASVLLLTTPAGTSHDLVEVPAGRFSMGSDSGEIDEQPVHAVTLHAYHIDRFEVTNAQYVAFMNTTRSNADSEGNELLNLGDSGVQIRETGVTFELREADYANLPVIEASWYGAVAYCEWMGARLPTEAEWEKAARGTDERTYPWGIASPTGDLTNYNFNVGTTTDVGSYPSGVSPYGAHDMAGNVWEWVSDWNDIGYYSQSPEQDPQGPASGTYRVFRGGSWGSNSGFGSLRVRSTKRAAAAPWSSGSGNLGFRCVIRP